jgi:hypothetical protein
MRSYGKEYITASLIREFLMMYDLSCSQIIHSQNLPKSLGPNKETHARWNIDFPNSLPRK